MSEFAPPGKLLSDRTSRSLTASRLGASLGLCPILPTDVDGQRGSIFSAVKILQESSSARSQVHNHLNRSVISSPNQSPKANLRASAIAPGGMNGDELAQAALAAKPDLKVLFTSGYAEPAVARQGLGAGAWLKKPYTAAELAETFARFSANSREPSLFPC
jgi:CheY-like chemotaxis protein